MVSGVPIIEGTMSPNKCKQGEIKTQNAQSMESAPQLCHWDVCSSFVTHERIFNLAWRQIFQGTMWALYIVKVDGGGKATLESRL